MKFLGQLMGSYTVESHLSQLLLLTEPQGGEGPGDDPASLHEGMLLGSHKGHLWMAIGALI